MYSGGAVALIHWTFQHERISDDALEYHSTGQRQAPVNIIIV